MSSFDFSTLGQKASAEDPCGKDCEYDEAFQSMEQAAQGQPERQIGETVEPATGSDWKSVRKHALAVLEQSIDIRATVMLARSALNLEGWSAFADTMQWLSQQLIKHWNGIHPRLDPDDNDATFRVNSFLPLAHPDALLGEIRETPIVRSPAIGAFSVRDIDIASGKIAAPVNADPETLPQANAIAAAFADVEIDALQADADALNSAITAVTAINETLGEQLGSAQALDFDPLLAELDSARRQLASRLSERGVIAQVPANSQPTDQPTEHGQTNDRASVSLPGVVNSRQDVAETLDRICEYYQRHEPTSPVPLLLNRAKSLVYKDFIEILKDVAPEAVAKVEALRGPVDDSTDTTSDG